MISFALDETLSLLRETCAEFAAARIRPAHRRAEEAGAVPDGLFAEAAEMGLGAVALPEAVGGGGLDLLAQCVVEEELACGDPAVAVALPGPGSAGSVVLACGTEEQRARLLAPFGEAGGAGLHGAFAHADADAGTPAFAERAPGAGGGWRLHGRKAHVIGAAGAELLVVTAQVRGAAPGAEEAGAVGVFAVAGGAASPGVGVGERRRTPGLRAVAIADVALDGADAEPLGAAGPAQGGEGLLRAFGRLTAVRAARELGCARACLEYAVRYGQERHAFGRPVAHFQANAFTLADMATQVDAGRWLLWRAARALEEGRPAWRGQVAMAAVHIQDAARRCADDALQLLGGHGYIQDHPLEKWMRDLRTLARVGLPVDVLREWEAREAFGTWDAGGASPSGALPDGDGPAVLT